jgi:hypothetical protein
MLPAVDELGLDVGKDRRRRTTRASRPPCVRKGVFAWNAFAFDHRIAARLDGQRQHEPVPHTNQYSAGDNRIDITLGDGAVSSLWWATKNEWLGLLDVAGLELEARYGGFAGEPFDDDSPETDSVRTPSEVLVFGRSGLRDGYQVSGPPGPVPELDIDNAFDVPRLALLPGSASTARMVAIRPTAAAAAKPYA